MKARLPALTKKQEDAVRRECDKQFKELLDKYNREALLQICAVLRFHYGFGQKRLQEFGARINGLQDYLRERYECPAADTAWLCERLLRDSGINVAELFGEEGKK